MHRRVKAVGWDNDDEESRFDVDPVGSLQSPSDVVYTPNTTSYLMRRGDPADLMFGQYVRTHGSPGSDNSPHSSDRHAEVSPGVAGTRGSSGFPFDSIPEEPMEKEEVPARVPHSKPSKVFEMFSDEEEADDVDVGDVSTGFEKRIELFASASREEGEKVFDFSTPSGFKDGQMEPIKKVLDFRPVEEFRKLNVSVDPPSPSYLTRDLRTPSPTTVEKSEGGDDGSSGEATPRCQTPAILEKLPPQRTKTAEERLRRELETWEDSGDKISLNLVTIGHVDAGKSTLMGHLLYELGIVSKKVLGKCEREAVAKGKGSFMYAWLLDSGSEERNRGVTMDVATRLFETEHRRVTLLDAPGHRDFIPNMISGAAQSDVALLVVDASQGEFEAGFDSDGQTKEHVVLVKSLGVSQLAVAVNKLDMVDWSKERFDEIVTKLSTFLKRSGFRNFVMVPVSGLTGENLVSRENKKLKWWTGPTLAQVIDGMSPSNRNFSDPFAFVISDVFFSESKGESKGISVSGKIEQGLVAADDRLLVLPLYQVAVIKSVQLQSSGDLVRWAGAGSSVNLAVGGIEQQNLSIGLCLCDPLHPLCVASRFLAKIVTLDITFPILAGYQCVLHVSSNIVPCTVAVLKDVIDRRGIVMKKKPRFLTRNVTAHVLIETERLVCFGTSESCKQLARFMLREGGRTVAVGLISEGMFE